MLGSRYSRGSERVLDCMVGSRKPLRVLSIARVCDMFQTITTVRWNRRGRYRNKHAETREGRRAMAHSYLMSVAAVGRHATLQPRHRDCAVRQLLG